MMCFKCTYRAKFHGFWYYCEDGIQTPKCARVCVSVYVAYRCVGVCVCVYVVLKISI